MKPYQQGKLDCTCGLYAVINSIRLASAPHRVLSEAESIELHTKLVLALERHQGMHTAVSDGIDTPVISTLYHAAKNHLAKQLALDLTWRKPYHSRALPRLDQAVQVMHRHVANGGVVFIGYDHPINSHWTVIKAINQRTITLFDSCGAQYIQRKNVSICDHSLKPYILGLRGLFLVSCNLQRKERP